MRKEFSRIWSGVYCYRCMSFSAWVDCLLFLLRPFSLYSDGRNWAFQVYASSLCVLSVVVTGDRPLNSSSFGALLGHDSLLRYDVYTNDWDGLFMTAMIR